MRYWLTILMWLLAIDVRVVQACPELSSSMTDVVSFSAQHDPNFPVVVVRPLSIRITEAGGHRTEVGTYEITEVIHGCMAVHKNVVVQAKCTDWLTKPDSEEPLEERIACRKMEESMLSGFTWEGRVLLPRALLVLVPVAESRGRAAVWREMEAHLHTWCDADVGYVPGLKRVIARMKKWASKHPARCAR
jgi:hypothetical protein